MATGPRELVLNAAHSSAVLHSAIDTPKIEDLTRLATDYVVNPGLNHILPKLMILQDRLYMLLVRYGQ